MNIEKPGTLESWLRAARLIAPDEAVEVVPLAGGVSCSTILVRRTTPPDWVVKQALAKLRVKADWFSDPARIEREALGIQHLSRIAPPGSITPLVFEDREHHMLGMEAVPQPHENWKTLLLRGELDPDHIRQFAEILAAIHRESALRRAELFPIFENHDFFETLRVEAYYGYSAEQVPEAAPFLHALIADMRTTQQTLVHGDYSPKNILIHNGRLVLLDHEVIHFGDPGFDLGFSLTHLLSKAHHLYEHRTAFAAAALNYWSIYREAAGNAGSADWLAVLEPRAIRHTLGCLLARVAGRSPLEYFSPETAVRQRRVVTALMQSPPQTMPSFITQFITGIGNHV